MSESKHNIDSIVSAIEKHWYKKTGLIAFAVLFTGMEIPVLAAIKPSFYVYIGCFLWTYSFLFLVWLYTNRLPKTKKHKIGFAVSIFCDPQGSSEKVRSDFVLTLRKLVKSGNIGKSFQFIEIPQHVAENIVDEDDARLLRLKCKAHFFLYGRVRIRKFEKQERHFIELDGVVAHQLIPQEISNKLAQEFGELLPRKVILSKENDLLSFEFTSQWTNLVAKYIIGIAAALSADLNYAEQLYNEVFAKLETISHSFPVFDKIKERIPIRLFELNAARAGAAHQAWTILDDDRYLEVLGRNLSKIDSKKHNTPMVLNLKSIYAFLAERDIEKSRSFLNRCKKQDRVAVWYLNHGFLAAYVGNLKLALQHYRKALRFDMTAELLSQIEDFIIYMLKIEPDKFQLYYCLGFFNWHFKGDYVQAIKDFETFLSNENIDKYLKAKELAENWLKEIQEAQKVET